MYHTEKYRKQWFWKELRYNKYRIMILICHTLAIKSKMRKWFSRCEVNFIQMIILIDKGLISKKQNIP